MSPYEALVLIALLLAIAAEWVAYREERERRRRRERQRAVAANRWPRLHVATGSGRRDYPPVSPTPRRSKTIYASVRYRGRAKPTPVLDPFD